MWYPIKANEIWVTLFLFFLVGPNAVDELQEGSKVGLVYLLGMLFLVGLGIARMVLKGVRTDERGIVVERRFALKHLNYPWERAVVTYRKKERRAAEGVLLELQGAEADAQPYFVPLRNMKERDELLTELRNRLGERFHEEEER